MPRTNAGCAYLALFFLATMGTMFAVSFIWDALGLPGTDFVSGVIMLVGIVATLRFAHRRSG